MWVSSADPKLPVSAPIALNDHTTLLTNIFSQPHRPHLTSPHLTSLPRTSPHLTSPHPLLPSSACASLPFHILLCTRRFWRSRVALCCISAHSQSYVLSGTIQRRRSWRTPGLPPTVPSSQASPASTSDPYPLMSPAQSIRFIVGIIL